MKWKSRTLINDPVTLDQEQIQRELESGKQVIVQFSHPSFYEGGILEEVNEHCARWNDDFGVRFYGHYSLSFDCHTLLRIPNVKMLKLDCLERAHHTEALDGLEHLHSLNLGIYEVEDPDILGMDALWSLRYLYMISEKKTVNLKYLAEYKQLERLHIGGKVKNLDSIGHLEDLRDLSLHSVSKEPLYFINRLNKLKSLRILLGGRENIREIEDNEIEELEICRVRGLQDLSNITSFHGLKKLIIEDQIRLQELHLDRGLQALEQLSILNCKGLTALTGLAALPSLRKLRMFKTGIEFNALISGGLPDSLTAVEFATAKKKEDQEIKAALEQLGYRSWRSLQ